MAYFTIALVAAATAVQAFPGAAHVPVNEVRAAADPRFTQWAPPGPGDGTRTSY